MAINCAHDNQHAKYLNIVASKVDVKERAVG